MKRLALHAGAALALLLGLAGQASARERLMYYEDRGLVLNAAALDGTAAARTTSAIFAEGFTTLALGVTLVDANSSVTALELTCKGSLDGASTAANYVIPIIVSTSASGTATYKAFTGSYATSGATNYSTTLGITGHKWVTCTCTATGTAATADTCSIRARVGVP